MDRYRDMLVHWSQQSLYSDSVGEQALTGRLKPWLFLLWYAALFPVIHVGRVWVVFISFHTQIQEDRCGPISIRRCCGIYDFSTYFLYHFYSGIQDLFRTFASIRNRASGFRKKSGQPLVFLDGQDLRKALASVGNHCHSCSLDCRHLLCFSVHTIVSFDFATSVIPWLAYYNISAIFCCRCDLLVLLWCRHWW